LVLSRSYSEIPGAEHRTIIDANGKNKDVAPGLGLMNLYRTPEGKIYCLGSVRDNPGVSAEANSFSTVIGGAANYNDSLGEILSKSIHMKTNGQGAEIFRLNHLSSELLPFAAVNCYGGEWTGSYLYLIRLTEINSPQQLADMALKLKFEFEFRDKKQIATFNAFELKHIAAIATISSQTKNETEKQALVTAQHVEDNHVQGVIGNAKKPGELMLLDDRWIGLGLSQNRELTALLGLTLHKHQNRK
jgi:hypothetical protein